MIQEIADRDLILKIHLENSKRVSEKTEKGSVFYDFITKIILVLPSFIKF